MSTGRGKPSFWTRPFRRRPQAEIDDEISFHLEERIADYVAAGMNEQEARNAAYARMGDIEEARRASVTLLERDRREELWRDRFAFSWLDVKLGLRMLYRYPGMTITGCVCLAFAIAIGAGMFQMFGQLVYPSLPFEDGDRIVAFENQDLATTEGQPTTMFDLAYWRDNIRLVEDIGGFLTFASNLQREDGAIFPVEAARISSSAFDVVQVGPYIGRTLIPADEAPGAPLVAVIGYEVWERAFDGDPTVIGSTVRVGRTPATVVGVMPPGFAFPMAQDLWTPLEVNASGYDPETAPPVEIFGKLSSGVSYEQASAELAAVGERLAAERPASHAEVRPEVIGFPYHFLPVPPEGGLIFFLLTVFFLAMATLVAGNVALLMYARTVSRNAELAIRTALGASRRRIVSQLLVEALLLTGLAAVIGIASARIGLGIAVDVVRSAQGNIPFWITGTLLPSTTVYVVAIGVVVAAVAGLLPALKATGKSPATRLRQVTAGGGGTRLGGVWTAVIILQVALTSVLPVSAYEFAEELGNIRATELDLPTDEYLIASFGVEEPADQPEAGDAAGGTTPERPGESLLQLRRVLLESPGVRSVTFANQMPRMNHPVRRIEVDAGSLPSTDGAAGRLARSGMIEPGFIPGMGASMVSGREFQPADLTVGQRVVIVNEAFVDQVMGGQNPVGRRLRYVDPVASAASGGAAADGEIEPWYQIVGVVQDMGMSLTSDSYATAGFYHPVDPAAMSDGWIALRVSGNPADFGGVVRSIAASVDPAIRLNEVMPLDRVVELGTRPALYSFLLIAIATALTVTMALAAIYAALAFTVARRTREIGIRIALGANHREIITAMFSRPAAHILIGVCLGVVLLSIVAVASGGSLGGGTPGLFLGSATAVALICAAAFLTPTRRILAIQPVEAMRTDE